MSFAPVYKIHHECQYFIMQCSQIKLALVWVLEVFLKLENPQADFFNSLFTVS